MKVDRTLSEFRTVYMNSYKFLLVLYLFVMSIYVVGAQNSLSNHVMLYNQSQDLRCAEDWDKLCNDTYEDKSKIHDISLCNWHSCANKSQVIRRGQVCDGTFDCSDLSDECLCDDKILQNKPTYLLCVRIYQNKAESVCEGINSDSVSLTQVCDKRVNCRGNEDEKYCQYHCKNVEVEQEKEYHECKRFGETVKLNWRHRFDNVRDCDDYSDEWHQHLPYCNDDYNLSYTCKYKQSTSHCAGPLRKHGNKKMVSTPESYMDSTFFYIMVMLLGFSAFCGNFALLLHLTVLSRLKKWRHRSSTRSFNSSVTSRRGSLNEHNVKEINKIMVLSLCVSDMLNGAQSLAWGITALVNSQNFWYSGYDMISSWLCIGIGSVAMLTNEASAFTILVIASVRLYTVVNPFTAMGKLHKKHVFVALGCAWAFSSILALIPLFHMGTFENMLIYSVGIEPVSNLEATIVERHSLENMVRNLALLQVNNSVANDFKDCAILQEKTWSELETFVNNITGGRTWNKYGYYSQPPSCLPPIIVGVNEPGWVYSLSIITMDFCAYIFVMIAYIIVYRRGTRGRFQVKHMDKRNKLQSSKRDDVVITSSAMSHSHVSKALHNKTKRINEESEMQKRIFLLVATDFACWIPMCSIAFARIVFGVDGVKTKHSFLLTICMVQLNSVINPIIYSRKARVGLTTFICQALRKISCVVKWQNAKENGAAQGNVHVESERAEERKELT